MPEVIQEKPNRKPQWIALVVSVLLVVGIVATVIVMQRTESQKKAFEAAKSSASSSDKHGDYKGAAHTLQSYLDSKPPKKYADQLYMTTATDYLNADNNDKAIEYYNKADQANPKDHAGVISGLALAYEYKGDKDKAIVYYKELLELTKRDNSADVKFEVKTIEGEITRLQGEGK